MSADDRMRRNEKLGEYLGAEAKTKMVGRAKRPPPRLAGLQLQHCETAEGHLPDCQACSMQSDRVGRYEFQNDMYAPLNSLSQ